MTETQLSTLDRAFAAVDPVMRGLDDDDLAKASPCRDWSVGDVAAHLLNAVERWAAVTEDVEPSPPAADSAAEIARSWDTTTARLRAALHEPGALDREVRGPGGGPMTVGTMMAIVPVEVVLHGWDIARGAALPTDFDAELARELLAKGRPMIEKFGRGTAFADEQPAAQDSTDADRLAAYYGRRVV